MDVRQRSHRGRRRPLLLAALLAVCAFGSVPAAAQVGLGPDVTVPWPIGGGGEGSTPDLTTTTTTAPPPTTPPTTAPAVQAPVTAAPAAPAAAAPSETSRRTTPAARRSSSSTKPAAPAAEGTFDVAPAVAEQAPAIARLRQVTLPAARQFGFPLALAVLVLAFLAVQGRLDARDPKLAAAPLSVDDDLLPFT